jgi:hypothetical protein
LFEDYDADDEREDRGEENEEVQEAAEIGGEEVSDDGGNDSLFGGESTAETVTLDEW